MTYSTRMRIGEYLLAIGGSSGAVRSYCFVLYNINGPLALMGENYFGKMHGFRCCYCYYYYFVVIGCLRRRTDVIQKKTPRWKMLMRNMWKGKGWKC